MVSGRVPAERKEYNLLVSGLLSDTDSAHYHRFEHLASEAVNWSDFFRLTIYHGVGSLLHRSLSAQPRNPLPEPVIAYLRQQARVIASSNQFFGKELGEVVEMLAAANLPVLTIKGLPLSQLAYGDMRVRPSTDIDILVRPKQFPDVERLLFERGYYRGATVQKFSRLQARAYIYLAKQYPFGRGSVFSMDVHTAIMPPRYYYRPSFDDLWRRSVTLSVGGKPVHSPSPEDLLLVLCYHGAKNQWKSLKYIADVNGLIRRSEGLDWDAIIREAQATRGERILHLGLALARGVLETPIPADVLRRFDRDQQAIEIANRFIERLPRQMELGKPGYRDRIWFYLHLQDTLATRARYSMFVVLRRLGELMLKGTAME